MKIILLALTSGIAGFWFSSISASSYPAIDVVPPIDEGWNNYFLNTPLQPDSTPDIYQCSKDTSWGASFDDGPSNQFTPQVLDELERRNIKATFFVVGSRVIENPGILKRAYQAGHQIGIHTWSHPDLTQLSNGQVIAEVLWTSKAIHDVIGVYPQYMRPPFGSMDSNIRALLRRMGLSIVLWSNDSRDWTGANVTQSVQGWVGSRSGEISLEHDVEQGPVSQVGSALDVIIQAGFQIQPIAECVNRSDQYSSIQQPFSKKALTATATSAPSPQITQSSLSGTSQSTLSNLALLTFFTFSYL